MAAISHRVAHRDIGNAGAHRPNDTGALDTGHPGQTGRIDAFTAVYVGKIDADRLDFNDGLVGSWGWVRQVHVPQHLGPAVFGNLDGFHVNLPSLVP